MPESQEVFLYRCWLCTTVRAADEKEQATGRHQCETCDTVTWRQPLYLDLSTGTPMLRALLPSRGDRNG